MQGSITVLIVLTCTGICAADIHQINMRAGLKLCKRWGWQDCPCLHAIRICDGMGMRHELDCELYHVERECKFCANTLNICKEEDNCNEDDVCIEDLNKRQDACMMQLIPGLRCLREKQIENGEILDRRSIDDFKPRKEELNVVKLCKKIDTCDGDDVCLAEHEAQQKACVELIIPGLKCLREQKQAGDKHINAERRVMNVSELQKIAGYLLRHGAEP